MTVINMIRLDGQEVSLDGLDKKKKLDLIHKMNTRALENLNYYPKEKTA